MAKVNGSLSKLGLPTVSSLPVITAAEQKKSVGDIFSPALISTTLLVTATYFLHILTFYFLVKWTPQILTMMKFSPRPAQAECWP